MVRKSRNYRICFSSKLKISKSKIRHDTKNAQTKKAWKADPGRDRQKSLEPSPERKPHPVIT